LRDNGKAGPPNGAQVPQRAPSSNRRDEAQPWFPASRASLAVRRELRH